MVTNLARKLEAVRVEQTVGRVTSAEGGLFGVDTPLGALSARRARSCLVEPAVGDEVLVCATERAAHVLAVLEAAVEGTTLAVDGDLTIRLADGRLAVAAQEGVSVVSGSDVSVTSPRTSVSTLDARVVADRLSWLGHVVEAEVDKVRVVARHVDRIADRVTDRVKRMFRRVEDVDSLQAGHIDWEAKRNLAVHCENALVTADKLVKMDADQVHIG
jgi:hypothetical protein